MANFFLAVLIGLMVIRDGSLLVRHRRPFRLAFVAFWVLLGYALFSGRSEPYPILALLFVTALVLRRRDLRNVIKLFEPTASKTAPGAGVWDRDLDGESPDRPGPSPKGK